MFGFFKKNKANNPVEENNTRNEVAQEDPTPETSPNVYDENSPDDTGLSPEDTDEWFGSNQIPEDFHEVEEIRDHDSIEVNEGDENGWYDPKTLADIDENTSDEEFKKIDENTGSDLLEGVDIPEEEGLDDFLDEDGLDDFLDEEDGSNPTTPVMGDEQPLVEDNDVVAVEEETETTQDGDETVVEKEQEPTQDGDETVLEEEQETVQGSGENVEEEQEPVQGSDDTDAETAQTGSSSDRFYLLHSDRVLRSTLDGSPMYLIDFSTEQYARTAFEDLLDNSEQLEVNTPSSTSYEAILEIPSIIKKEKGNEELVFIVITGVDELLLKSGDLLSKEFTSKDVLLDKIRSVLQDARDAHVGIVVLPTYSADLIHEINGEKTVPDELRKVQPMLEKLAEETGFYYK